MPTAREQAEMDAAGREALLREYDVLEDHIESASFAETWALGDWLAAHVPNDGVGGDRQSIGRRGRMVTLSDLAERGRHSERWLARLRRTAALTIADRQPGVSVHAYDIALRANDNDLARANAAIQEQGTTVRSHRTMETMDSLRREIAARPPAERAEIAAEILRENPEAIARAVEDPIGLSTAMTSVSNRIEVERDRRMDERERVQQQLTEDEQKARRIKSEMRHGNYGQAERILESMEDLSVADPYLQEHLRHLEGIVDWLHARLDRRVPDAVPEEWSA